jgi:hypothetical protein
MAAGLDPKLFGEDITPAQPLIEGPAKCRTLSTMQLENGDDQTSLGDAHPDDPPDSLREFFSNAAFDALFQALSGFGDTSIKVFYTSAKVLDVVVRCEIDVGLPIRESVCQNRSSFFCLLGRKFNLIS